MSACSRRRVWVLLRVPPEEPRGMGTTFPPNCRLVPERADPHFIAVLCTVSPFPSALQCQNTSRLRVPAWVCVLVCSSRWAPARAQAWVAAGILPACTCRGLSGEQLWEWAALTGLLPMAASGSENSGHSVPVLSFLVAMSETGQIVFLCHRDVSFCWWFCGALNTLTLLMTCNTKR